MNVMKTMMKWPLLIILMMMMMIITIDGWRNVERSTTPAIQPCDIGNWPHLLHHHHHHNVDIQDQPYHVKVVFFFFHKSNHKTHLKIEEAQYILHQYKTSSQSSVDAIDSWIANSWISQFTNTARRVSQNCNNNSNTLLAVLVNWAIQLFAIQLSIPSTELCELVL